MSSYEHNFLNNRAGPESPSILSVNPHGPIPTVSAKMATTMHHRQRSSSTEHIIEWDPTTDCTINTGSPCKGDSKRQLHHDEPMMVSKNGGKNGKKLPP